MERVVAREFCPLATRRCFWEHDRGGPRLAGGTGTAKLVAFIGKLGSEMPLLGVVFASMSQDLRGGCRASALFGSDQLVCCCIDLRCYHIGGRDEMMGGSVMRGGTA